ncbi:MAG: ABC transporter substrate-binding protein [Burkholderiales bacterium]|nr:ABC transporter substrate-binding protein [Burkholderiales bacterium]
MLGQAVAAEKNIVIAQAIDLSGPNAAIGRDYVAGITTYFDTVNMQGGLNGRHIQYVVQDDKGDPALSAKIAGDLADKADFVLGGIGNDTASAVLANPNFKQSGQVLFAPLASPNRDLHSRAVFWRPGQEQEIDYIFTWFDKLGIRNVGIAYQENNINPELLKYVQQVIAKRGLRLAGIAKVGKNPIENEKEASQLAANAPNMVISLADSIGTGLFLKQFRKHAERTFVAGTSLINLPTLTEIAGAKATEWTVFSQVVPNPSATTSLLQNEHLTMMKRFRDEDVSSMTLEGFAVAKSLLKAIAMSKNGTLQHFAAHKNNIDLGGLNILPTSTTLSSYVDIALLRKGRSLMF